MDNIKVSVIVPCYNVAPYLRRCIGSLARQSLREMEIIAVNDSSPDDTQRILEELQEEIGPRLRLFQKENGGLSHTRNFGLEQAKGEYIAFLDGDDYADLDLYEVLYRRAVETDADAVACSIRYVWEDGSSKWVSPGIPSLCEGAECKDVFTRFYPAVWNKLYKKEILDRSGVRFKCGALFEDVEFSHRLFPFFRRLASVEMASVNYVQREGSITSKPDRRLFDYIGNFESILAFYRERDLWEEWHPQLEYAACRYLLATFLKRAAALSDEDFEEAVSQSLAFLQREFPEWRKNPYFWKNGGKGLYLRFFSPKLARLMRKREQR